MTHPETDTADIGNPGLTYDDEDSTPWAEAFWDSMESWPKGHANRIKYTALWFDQLQEVGRRHPKAEAPK
jgi:hypothetical protein